MSFTYQQGDKVIELLERIVAHLDQMGQPQGAILDVPEKPKRKRKPRSARMIVNQTDEIATLIDEDYFSA